MTRVYVDLNAPAGGNGTLMRPYREFAEACRGRQAGDEIYLAPGDYSAQPAWDLPRGVLVCSYKPGAGCLAKDDGSLLYPRCFCRLRSPGPNGVYEPPASGPLCFVCSEAVRLVVERPTATTSVRCVACNAWLVVRRSQVYLEGTGDRIDLESFELVHTDPVCGMWLGPLRALCAPELPPGKGWGDFMPAAGGPSEEN